MYFKWNFSAEIDKNLFQIVKKSQHFNSNIIQILIPCTFSKDSYAICVIKGFF